MEPALFTWKGPEGFIGLVCVHVDDFLWAGNSEFLKVISMIRSTFRIGSSEQNTFKYIGLNIKASGGGVTIDQFHYIQAIAPLS